MKTTKYIYEFEPMHGDLPVELEYKVCIDSCPGDRDTPPAYDCYVESIKHKGKEISTEALELLFSAYHGREMGYEDIEKFLIEDSANQPDFEKDNPDADAEYFADIRYDQWKEERMQ